MLEKRKTLSAANISNWGSEVCCIDADNGQTALYAWAFDIGVRSHFRTTLGGLGRKRVVEKKTEDTTH